MYTPIIRYRNGEIESFTTKTFDSAAEAMNYAIIKGADSWYMPLGGEIEVVLAK